jgi:PAS domain-containing protein
MPAQDQNDTQHTPSDDGEIASGVHTWIVPENLVFADRSASELFGFSPSEGRVGRPLCDYMQRIHPDDLAHVSQSIAVP